MSKVDITRLDVTRAHILFEIDRSSVTEPSKQNLLVVKRLKQSNFDIKPYLAKSGTQNLTGE